MNSEQDWRVAIVVKGYPRLSETFIAQEILELQRAGFRLEIVSLRHPTDKSVHPVHREIAAPVSYLPEYLHDEPRRVFAAWRQARAMPGYRRALAAFLRDLARDFTANRVRRFGQAMVLAAEHARRVSFLYVHFIHTPGSVARYAAMMTGVPFAISAHAKDIWTTPDWELREKLGDCRWCVTCTRGGLEQLRSLAPDPSRVHLVYHGLDLSRFPPPPRREKPADAHVSFLTVGRAVPKKGIDTLVDALALLPADLDWRWTHVGGGPDREKLAAQAARLGLSARCAFLGSQPQEAVLEAYRSHDVFVLPCRIDEDGDRDGLPNVIVEAQSQALPVLTTPVSGIPELVADGVNGLFVAPDDPAALAARLLELARDRDLRRRLGEAGERRVRADFDHLATIGDLRRLLSGSLAGATQEAAA